MPGLVPNSTVYEVRRDQPGMASQGVVVWALQRALNRMPYIQLGADGSFGRHTEVAVRAFQQHEGLIIDGVFGGNSSRRMANWIADHVGRVSVPDGILHGLINGESSGLIGAIGAETPGGLDCGWIQRRVMAANYNDAATVHRAFSPNQIPMFAATVRSRRDSYLNMPGVHGDNELAWRLAVLCHNYPYAVKNDYGNGITQVGVSGLSSYWTSRADWVVGHNRKFDDGVPVQTPLEWCQHYSLGAPAHNHPGVMVRDVHDWSA